MEEPLILGIKTEKWQVYKQRWFHIVGTYDGSLMQLYLNGSLQKSALVSMAADASEGRGNLEIAAYMEAEPS